ncbi:MAG: glycosyltransferase [Bacteroidetes bacterium]|nr:MAG: glycosyltransferase [Bacteroidota bacterium]
MQQKNLIIIFTRNPELGKVKTRLAKTIGNEAALNIYRFLLNHTEKTIRNIDCDKAIYYSSEINHNDIWDEAIYQKHLQQGNDLGKKMQNAFESAFSKDYNKVVIVGSDLFDLQPKHIEDTFSKLNTHDVVIGPAKDGGYYLLGMKTLNSQVFKKKEWGTSTVIQNTLQDLKHIDVHLLEELNDIDIYDDIKNIEELKQLIK